jgi:hypothetical protein
VDRTDRVATDGGPEVCPPGRRWLSVAFSAGALALGMVLLRQGFGGFSVVPEITGEREVTPYGWVFVLLGLMLIALVPLTLAVISGGRGQIGAGLAGLGIGLMVAVLAGVAGVGRVSTVITLGVGATAVVALGRSSLIRLVVRALAVVLVAFGVAMTGTGLAVIGPVAALVAVGVADELGTRLRSH